jgi:hypothetical protein
MRRSRAISYDIELGSLILEFRNQAMVLSW